MNEGKKYVQARIVENPVSKNRPPRSLRSTRDPYARPLRSTHDPYARPIPSTRDRARRGPVTTGSLSGNRKRCPSTIPTNKTAYACGSSAGRSGPPLLRSVASPPFACSASRWGLFAVPVSVSRRVAAAPRPRWSVCLPLWSDPPTSPEVAAAPLLLAVEYRRGICGVHPALGPRTGLAPIAPARMERPHLPRFAGRRPYPRSAACGHLPARLLHRYAATAGSAPAASHASAAGGPASRGLRHRSLRSLSLRPRYAGDTRGGSRGGNGGGVLRGDRCGPLGACALYDPRIVPGCPQRGPGKKERHNG